MKVVHKSKKIFNGTYKGYFTGCVVSVEGVASFFASDESKKEI